jgi:hypothetical protein
VRARVVGPLPQALQRLGVTERDGRLQVAALLHLGRVQHGIDQAGPPAGPDVPGGGVQRRARGLVIVSRADLGGGDGLLAVLDLYVSGLGRLGHGGAPSDWHRLRSPAQTATALTFTRLLA